MNAEDRAKVDAVMRRVFMRGVVMGSVTTAVILLIFQLVTHSY